MNRKKGLTLLELILALTMLSIILVASGSLNLFVLRAANLTAEETRLQNQLEYVFKDMNIHMTESSLDKTENDTNCTDENCLILKDSSGTQFKYDYAETSPGSNVFQLSREQGANISILSEILVPTWEDDGITEMPIFKIKDSENKLVEVNLSAQTTKPGKTIRIESASRSFFLRGRET